MSYDKLYFAYYDKGGAHHEISIFQTSPVSTYNIAYAGDDAVSISHNGNGKNDWDQEIIQGKELIFKFYVPRDDADAVFIPLLESEYQDWKVEYKIDSVM